MAGYTRQSSFADGDTITAALFNDEYNQLVNAFNNSTGHSHDGTTAEGPVIGLIGDAGETSPNNKVLIDTTNNYIEFYIEVSSAPVQQLYIADGAIVPVTDSDIDLGTTSLRFKDTYTDTVTTTGNVTVGGNLTVTGNATISGNLTFGDADTDSINLAAEIDSDIIPNTDGTYDLGSATKEWQDLYIDGTANIDSLVADTADINAGTIDNTVIGGTTAVAGSFTTATATTGNITTVNATTVDTTNIEVTNIKAKDGTSAGSIADSTGVVTLASSVLTTTDINGGTIDNATIATSNITVGTGKTLDVSSGTLTLADNQISGNKVEGGTIAGITITDLTFGNLNDGTITIANFIDDDTFGTASATTLPTSESVKAYVDSQVTAQDLDFQGDSGGALSIDLDSETLTIAGGTGIDTSGATNTLTVSIDSTVATLTGTQTLTNKTLTSPVINTGVSGTAVLDDDTFATASNTTLATSESIKAYVDAVILTEDTLAEMNDVNITTPADGSLLFYDTGTSMWIDNVVSGDITIADTGVAAISSGVIVNDDINASAAISVSKTALVDGTGLTLTGDTLSVDASQTQITAVGTLTTGTWNATSIADAYVDNNLTIDGGTVDNSVIGGSTPAAGTFTTLTANTSITGTLATAAQTNITSVGTLSSLVVSGDLTVDTNTLFVDSTNNRVGILDATPAVTLDIGSATDAIFVPSGTTAQRPTGANGYFRYNTDDAQFEGYADGAWGAIAGSGGGGSAMEQQILSGDGSTTGFTLTSAPTSENNLLVFVDGVFQAQDTYSVSGTTLTFSTAPANGRVITVYHILSSISGSNMIVDSMTGDGSDVTLTLSVAPVSENNVQVYIDGVYQSKSNYSISGTTLTFTTAPPSGTAVEAITHTQTSINTPANGSVAPASIASGDFYFDTDTLYIDATNNRVGIGTSSPTATLDVTSASSDAVFLRSSNATTSNVYITNTNATTGNTANLYFAPANNVAGSQISSIAIEDFSVSANRTADLAFSTRLNGTMSERMRIDSSGNIGIGASLSHDTGVSGNKTLLLQNRLRLYNTAVDGTTDGTIGVIDAQTRSSGATYQTGRYAAIEFCTDPATYYFGDIRFFTNNSDGTADTGTERMRIDSSGFLQIATTGKTGRINLQPNPSNNHFVEFYTTSDTKVGEINTTGGTTTNYVTSSDYRLKENVDYDFNALDRVAQLKPARFNFIADVDTTVDGFLAHEVQDIVPEAIHGVKDEVDEDGNAVYQGIDQSKLVPLLTKAIQEQQTIIEDLKARIETLENA
jgi:hypothetical protein